MPTYTLTVTTGANEEKGLDLVLARENAARAAQTPPKTAITKQQYLQNLVDGCVSDYKRQYKQDLRERTGAALDTANAAKVSQVAALLGVTE